MCEVRRGPIQSMRHVLPALLLASGCVLFPALDYQSSTPVDGGAGDVFVAEAGDVSVPDAGADAGHWTFMDDFNRANAPALGNGWVEKQPVFWIVNNQAAVVTAGSDYRDSIAYRPPMENVTDVTASVELRYGTSAGGYPQLHVRVQTASVVSTGVLDDYLLFPASGGTTDMVIARNRGNATFTMLTSYKLTTPLDTAHMYRLTLSAIGVSPVALTATVERLDVSTWTSLGTATVQDSDPERVTGPGSVGFSAGSEPKGQFVYDNFKVTGR